MSNEIHKTLIVEYWDEDKTPEHCGRFGIGFATTEDDALSAARRAAFDAAGAAIDLLKVQFGLGLLYASFKVDYVRDDD